MYRTKPFLREQRLTDKKAKHEFFRHAALAEHYERFKMASANNAHEYYRYAELQHYHISRAYFYKSHFSAISLI